MRERKLYLRYTFIALVILVFWCPFIGCKKASTDMRELNTISVSEYIFRVESAIIDKHNMVATYSLRRSDGNRIHPEIRFEEISSMPKENSGGSVGYRLSEDQKTLWIEEKWSSSKKQGKRQSYMVTMKNIIGDDGETLLESDWSLAFTPDQTDEIIEWIDDEMIISTDNRKIYRISNIQLSPVGLFVEMYTSNTNIDDVAENFSVILEFSDGQKAELKDKHFYFNENKKKAGYYTTCEAIFDSLLDPEDVSAIVICGYSISVG